MRVMHKTHPRKRVRRPFKGPEESVALASVRKAMSWISTEQYVELDDLKGEITRLTERFVSLFYKQVSLAKDRSNRAFLDGCKRRHSDLKSLLELTSSTEADMELFIVTKSTGRKVYMTDQVHYLQKKYELKGLLEDDIVADVYVTQAKPKIYGCLHVAMMKLIPLITEFRGVDDGLFQSCSQMAQMIISFGGIYNLFDPDDRVMREFEEETLQILTEPPRHEEASGLRDENVFTRDEIEALFRQVLYDIEESPRALPYVQEFRTALKATEAFRSSPYSYEDYYISMKSSSSRIKGFKGRQAFLKATVETDPFRDCPFDEAVGYTSHYNLVEPEGYEAPWVKTIHIPNPGKFKPRAIHIGLNAIQDRCKYLARRIQKFNSHLISDCTKNQEQGILFLMKITTPEFREEHGWPSVLCMDWSNATDRIDQQFQRRVLEILFKDERILDYWDQISQCEKEYVFCDRSTITYKQLCGQPQGLLGSFDAFTLAHHVIMLMTMRASGLEGYKASAFYRVLGDDSAMTSIVSDPTNLVGDCYCQICSWANMKINREKSVEILGDKVTALADFAKVTILNGKYFSPLPTRLSVNIADPKGNYYSFAAALWMGSHGYNVTKVVDSLVLESWGSDPVAKAVAENLVYGGISPRFDDWRDDSKVHLDCLAKCKISYLVSKIQSSFAQTLLGDKVREDLDLMNYVLKDALSELFYNRPEYYLDRIEDPHHKVIEAVERNIQIEDAIKAVLGLEGARIWIPSLDLTEQEYEILLITQEVLELIRYVEPDRDDMVSKRLNRVIRNLRSLDRFNMRSVYKRDATETMVLNGSIAIFKRLFPEWAPQDVELI